MDGTRGGDDGLDGEDGGGLEDGGAARREARRRDAADPLASHRDRFALSDRLYADGNSLGPPSDAAVAAVEDAVAEWRAHGVRGWREADWFTVGERLGARLAPLVGARESEVVVTGSTTVNLHTLAGTFYDPGRGRRILVNELDFPSDHYALRSQLRLRGVDPDDGLRVVASRDGRTVRADDVVDAMDDDVGLVVLPSVLYRSGQLLDLERIVAAARERSIPVGLDLAHSVGVVPHELSALGVDFAVWCSYKYLNAGPGATAGLYVHERHHGRLPALAGWWGHEKATQFEMRGTFTPAASAGAWQVGTPPLFSTVPLDGALDVLADAGVDRVREKSLALTGFLIDLVDEHLPECEVGTPRAPERRGGHVAVEHPDAYRLSRALVDRGVVVDFRPPNVVRVCPAPLYFSFEDVLDVVAAVRDVLDAGAHEAYDAPDGGVT
jgi:kynureninase